MNTLGVWTRLVYIYQLHMDFEVGNNNKMHTRKITCATAYDVVFIEFLNSHSFSFALDVPNSVECS